MTKYAFAQVYSCDQVDRGLLLRVLELDDDSVNAVYAAHDWAFRHLRDDERLTGIVWGRSDIVRVDGEDAMGDE